MRSAPPPTTTGWQERVCNGSVDAQPGGGQARGAGARAGREDVVGSEGEAGKRQAGQGQGWGALCPGRKLLEQLNHLHAPSLPLRDP